MKGLETRKFLSGARGTSQISSRIQMRLMLVLLIKRNATAALVDYHREEGGGGVPARVSRSHTAPTRHAPLPLSL